MILGVTFASVRCPFCGESIELAIEMTLAHQQYVEDCEVCCRPMIVTIDASQEEPVVNVTREDE